VTRRLLLLAVCAIVLGACRLDVSVDVAMEPDGTGVVTLVATADQELVAQVPDLVDDLRLDDATANGWVVEGPTDAEGGWLTITMTHAFTSPDELANVLNSIGPPLTRMAAARTSDATTEQTTNAINGELVLADGFASFADADLLAAVGGLPFGAEIAASGLAPSDAMSFTFRVDLPGELISAETGTEVGDGVIEWRAPLDGTTVNLYTATVQRPAGSGSSWAAPMATVALVALVAWSVLAIAFIAFVVVARRAKRVRRERALRRLERRPVAADATRDDEPVR
jgi:hypothetical protein